MNANEVISPPCVRTPIPTIDVNRGQSSNDVIPTAMHIAAAETVITAALLPSIMRLLAAVARKAAGISRHRSRSGRTHLQDAVPMRMGQEFGGYAQQVKNARDRVEFPRCRAYTNCRWAAPR